MAEVLSLILASSQVAVSLALAIFVLDIHRKLRDVDALKGRASKASRAVAFQFRFSSQMTAYMKALEAQLWQLAERPGLSSAGDLKALQQSLSELKRGRQVVALFGKDFQEIQTALMDLSQVGDEKDFEAAWAVIQTRKWEMEQGGFDPAQFERIEAILHRWTTRLRQQGKIIITASWAAH